MGRTHDTPDPWPPDDRLQPLGAEESQPQAAREAETRTNLALRKARQVLDYCFLILYLLVGLRIFLLLIGARPGNPFMAFIRALTAPFLRWFEGLVPPSPVGAAGRIEWSFVIALGVYALLH